MCVVEFGRETDHSTFSGDKPATGPLGLLLRPVRFDLPLSGDIFRPEQPFVKAVAYMPSENTLQLKRLLADWAVGVLSQLLRGRNNPDPISPARSKRPKFRSCCLEIGKETT